MENKKIEDFIINYKNKDFTNLKLYIENKKFISLWESNIVLELFNKLYKKEKKDSIDYKNWVDLLKKNIIIKKNFQYLKFEEMYNLEQHSILKEFLIEKKIYFNKKEYIIYKFFIEYKKCNEKNLSEEKYLLNYLNNLNELINKYKVDLKNFDDFLQQDKTNLLFFIAINKGYNPTNVNLIKNFKNYLENIRENSINEKSGLSFVLEQIVKTKLYIHTIQPSKNLEKQLNCIFDLKNLKINKEMYEFIINHPIFKFYDLKINLENQKKIELFDQKFLNKENQEKFENIQKEKDQSTYKKKLKI